jgi:hypothetical protein
MPTGPKGERRPADVIGNAVKVMRIATGEESDDAPDDGKNKAAQELGRKGGNARAGRASPERRKKNLRRKHLPSAGIKHNNYNIFVPISRTKTQTGG